MANIRVDITPENTDDRALVRRGHGTEPDIPRTTVSGLVDTDAVLLRAKLVEVLGLRRRSGPTCAGLVTVLIGDRSSMTDCNVGRPAPRSSSAASCSRCSTSSPTMRPDTWCRGIRTGRSYR